MRRQTERGDRRGRPGAVPDRRARRRHAAGRAFRRFAAPRRRQDPAGRQQVRGAGERGRVARGLCARPGRAAGAVGRARTGAGRPARGAARLCAAGRGGGRRRAGRSRGAGGAGGRGGARGGGGGGARSRAVADGRGRPAQRRQVDAGQPPDRRGAAADRAGGGDHARFHRAGLGVRRPPGAPGGHCRPAQARARHRQGRAPVRRRHQAGHRLCQRRGVDAGRRGRGQRLAAGKAGPDHRPHGDRGGARPGHRVEQVGRLRRPDRCHAAAARPPGAFPAADPGRADRRHFGAGGARPRQAAAGDLRRLRGVERAAVDRPAQSLAGGGDQPASAAGAGRPAHPHQVRHPGQDAAADLRAVLLPAEGAAGQLPALSGEFPAPGLRAAGARRSASSHAPARIPM